MRATCCIRRHVLSYLSCSRWGLPCHCCYQQSGALLPHHFTLTIHYLNKLWRYIFCGTFHQLTLSRSYLASCPMEPGLSSAYSDCLTDSPHHYKGNDWEAESLPSMQMSCVHPTNGAKMKQLVNEFYGNWTLCVRPQKQQHCLKVLSFASTGLLANNLITVDSDPNLHTVVVAGSQQNLGETVAPSSIIQSIFSYPFDNVLSYRITTGNNLFAIDRTRHPLLPHLLLTVAVVVAAAVAAAAAVVAVVCTIRQQPIGCSGYSCCLVSLPYADDATVSVTCRHERTTICAVHHQYHWLKNLLKNLVTLPPEGSVCFFTVYIEIVIL